MADSKPLCMCGSAAPPGGMTSFNIERPLAPAVLPEIPGKIGSPCFDWVLSVTRTVTMSLPSRSPVLVVSARACPRSRPHTATLSKSPSRICASYSKLARLAPIEMGQCLCLFGQHREQPPPARHWILSPPGTEVGAAFLYACVCATPCPLRTSAQSATRLFWPDHVLLGAKAVPSPLSELRC